MQVVALALEESMFFDVKDNVQIAGGSTAGTGFAVSGEPDAGTVFYAGGNFGFDGALADLASFAFAFRAGIGDDVACALAGRAGAGDAEEPLLVADLAAAVAGAALDGGFAGSSA